MYTSDATAPLKCAASAATSWPKSRPHAWLAKCVGAPTLAAGTSDAAKLRCVRRAVGRTTCSTTSVVYSSSAGTPSYCTSRGSPLRFCSAARRASRCAARLAGETAPRG